MLLSQAIPPDPSITALPLAAHVVVAAGLMIGLLLWLFGRTLFRPLFAAFGATAGCLAGFFLIPSLLPATVFDVPSPYWGMGIGAALGLTLGFLLYRVAVAVGMGLVVGLASLLITAAILNTPEVASAGEVARDALPKPEALHQVDRIRTLKVQDLQQSSEVAIQVRNFFSRSATELTAAWNEIPRQDQIRLGFATFLGTFCGFLVGLIAPRRSAAASTALFGAAVWIPATVWLLHALEAPGRGLLNLPAVAWLILWALMATLGFILQGALKRQKKPAEG